LPSCRRFRHAISPLLRHFHFRFHAAIISLAAISSLRHLLILRHYAIYSMLFRHTSLLSFSLSHTFSYAAISFIFSTAFLSCSDFHDTPLRQLNSHCFADFIFFLFSFSRLIFSLPFSADRRDILLSELFAFTSLPLFAARLSAVTTCHASRHLITLSPLFQLSFTPSAISLRQLSLLRFSH